MESSIIERIWAGFAEKCLHPESPATQILEVKKAFFSGFAGCLIALKDDPVPKETEEKMDELIAEYRAFIDDLRKRNV